MIEIRYCVVRNYKPRAVSLAAKIKDRLKLETNIIPGDKGEFNIYDTNGQLIFSKKDLGRFPETDEIISLLKSSI
jgi:selT/selW/selH-like putative selenoprotein